MNELKEKRSLNSKHYSREDGQFDGEFFDRHIHYNNKLGFGDGEKGLRGIDYTLIWDDIRKGWYFNFGSFNPFIPEYADQTSEFRDLFEDKDQTVRYTPQCQHIKGRLVLKEDLKKEGLENQTTENCVIYDNAQEDGIDLIYCFLTEGLRKLYRIRKGTKAKNYKFKFKVEFPGGDKEVYRADKKEDVKLLKNTAYKLDKTKDKTFDTGKQILIGKEVEGKEWATYIASFKCWSGFIGEIIKVDMTVGKDGIYFTKNVRKEFIESAKEDVFTDTDTYFNSATIFGRLLGITSSYAS